MTRTLSMLAGIRRLAVAGAAAVLLLIVLTGGVAQAAGSLSNTTAPAISGTAQSGKTLTADPGGWSGDTSGGFSYQWQRCDTLGANCSPIAGATSSTYTAQEFGITLVVEVTALDGPTAATSAATAVVRTPDPAGGSCTLAPRIGDADSTVFAVSCEGWSDYNQADPLTYSVQWWGCDGNGDNCALENQSIPTTDPYVEGMLSGFRDTLGGGIDRVTMIICEFDGSCTSWSDLAYIVDDGLPHNDPAAPPTVNGHLWLGETLSADPGAWSNNPTGYSYQWMRCVSVWPGYDWRQRHDPLMTYTDCAPIDGATGAAHTVQPSDLGYAFAVQVTASIAQGQTTVAGPTTGRLAGPPSAALAGVTVNTGTLSPAFDAATSSYSLTVPYSTSTIALTPTLDDANATVKIDGTSTTSGTAVSKQLSVGANTFTTVVTAQDGTTTQTYTVTVTRAAGSQNAALSDLAFSEGALNPAFQPGTGSYTVAVPNDVTSATLTPTVADANASVTVNGSPVMSGSAAGLLGLPVGATTLTVTVTAQVGSTRTYTVTVTRAAAPVSNPSTPLPPVAPAITPMPTLTVVLATQTGTKPRSTRPGALPPVTAPEFSTKATVKLETAAPAGTTQVAISNNADFSNATTFPVNPYGIYEWTLAEMGAANGDRTVHVRFVIPDSLTTTLTANVKLDDKAPVVSKPHYLAKSKGSIKVSVAAADQASGVRFTQFAPNVRHPWGWTRYTAKPSVRTKQTFIYVRAADGAGNVSAWQRIAFPAKAARK